MPYTFTHPGFTFPFKQRIPSVFSTTGLIFGSIAPDYDILLRITHPRFHIFQYDLKSIFLFVFPLAFLSTVYYHLIIRNILIKYAPTFLKKQLEDYSNFNYLHYLKTNFHKVFFSIIFAVYLHLFLDLVSHWDAYTFKIIAINYFYAAWIGWLFYYGAMYLPVILFSIAGIWLIIGFIKKQSLHFLSFSEIRPSKKTMMFLIVFLCISFLFCCIKIYLSGIETGFAIDSIVISFTNGLLISFYLTPALFFILNKIKTTHE